MMSCVMERPRPVPSPTDLVVKNRCLAVAHTRLADGDRTDTGHHLALRQVTVAHDPLVAVCGLQIGMPAEKVGDLASTA